MTYTGFFLLKNRTFFFFLFRSPWSSVWLLPTYLWTFLLLSSHFFFLLTIAWFLFHFDFWSHSFSKTPPPPYGWVALRIFTVSHRAIPAFHWNEKLSVHFLKCPFFPFIGFLCPFAGLNQVFCFYFPERKPRSPHSEHLAWLNMSLSLELDGWIGSIHTSKEKNHSLLGLWRSASSIV